MHFSLICSLSDIHFAKHGAAIRTTKMIKISISLPQKETAQQKVNFILLTYDVLLPDHRKNRQNVTDHRVRDDVRNLDEQLDESHSDHAESECRWVV